jgi:WD40 repeat protein
MLIAPLVSAIFTVATAGCCGEGKSNEATPEKRPATDLHGDPLPPNVARRFGTVRFRLIGRADRVGFSPDSKTLTTWTDSDVQTWDAATGQLVPTPADDPDPPNRSWGRKGPVALSRDKQLRATTEGQTIYIWHEPTGKELHRLKAREESFNEFAFSPDGRLLASGGNCWADPKNPKGFPASMRTIGMARLWDLQTGKAIHALQADPNEPGVVAVAFAPDGKLVATSCATQSVHLWDVPTGKLVRTLQKYRCYIWSSHAISFSPDGRSLASMGGHRLCVWDVATGKLRDCPEGHETEVCALAVSPDGRTIASGDNEGTVRIWDVDTAKPEKVFRRLYRVKSLTFSPDGKTLAAGYLVDALGYFQSTIRLWDIALGKERHQMRARGVTQLTYSPDGKMLASGDGIQVWDVQSRSGDRIQVWDVQSGTEIASFAAPSLGRTGALRFSSDGGRVQLLAEGERRPWMQTWQVGHDKPVKDIPWPKEYMFHGGTLSSDGSLAATKVYKLEHDERGMYVIVWDAGAGVRRSEFPIPGNAPVRLVFSPDNRFLATVPNEWKSTFDLPEERAHDRLIRVWELASGQLSAAFALPRGNDVLCLAFAPDQTALYSGMEDSTVLAWSLQPQPKESALSPAHLEALWADLANADARRAFQAMQHLRSFAPQTTPFLIRQLRPAHADAPRLRRLIQDLGHDEFARRDTAYKELDRLAGLAEPALRWALDDDLALEARRRIDLLLAKLPRRTTKAPEHLRALRAVAVLEWSDTRESLEGLKILAQDAPTTWAAQAAQAALANLGRKPKR